MKLFHELVYKDRLSEPFFYVVYVTEPKNLFHSGWVNCELKIVLASFAYVEL